MSHVWLAIAIVATTLAVAPGDTGRVIGLLAIGSFLQAAAYVVRGK